MTEYILSIDPGVSTGIALISYEEDSTPELAVAWQFTGGAKALKEWVNRHWSESDWDSEWNQYYGAHLNPFPSRWVDLYPESAYDQQYDSDLDDMVTVETETKNLTVIAEKFTARNTKGFSYTTASLEPLRGEGILLAKDMMPDYTPKEKRWRDPGLQYLVGGSDLADKKKRQHAFLKDAGFYRTNKDFPDSPSKDGADDFRSAAAHGIAYLAREVKHKPSFDLISEWAEGKR